MPKSNAWTREIDEPTDEDLADFDLLGQGYSFYVEPESQPKCLWEERANG